LEEERVVEVERIEGALMVELPLEPMAGAEAGAGEEGVGLGGAGGAGRGFLSLGMF
jgi:hypothetical protein